MSGFCPKPEGKEQPIAVLSGPRTEGIATVYQPNRLGPGVLRRASNTMSQATATK